MTDFLTAREAKQTEKAERELVHLQAGNYDDLAKKSTGIQAGPEPRKNAFVITPSERLQALSIASRINPDGNLDDVTAAAESIIDWAHDKD